MKRASTIHDIQAYELASTIREAIKAQNISLRDLAKRMNVSLATLKRWLCGEGIQLSQWLKLLTALDLTLVDITAQFQAKNREQFEYTEKQEEAFCNTPGLLAFFDQLLKGNKPRKIANEYGLPIATLASYLHLLDDLNLIQWQSQNEAKLLVKGEPKWRPNGPLAKKFRNVFIAEFINVSKNNANSMKMGTYELQIEDIIEIEQQILNIFKAARTLEARNKIFSKKTTSYGLLVGLDKFRPKILKEISNG